MKKDIQTLLAENRPLLMGILNITPDSFHDGGRFLDAENAKIQMKRLIDDGADIIDIGAASSRPGHIPVSAEEEWARLAPVLEHAGECPCLLSVDTDKLDVAEKALAAGVDILNYTGGLLDDDIFRLAARTGAPLIWMHRWGEEGSHDDVVAEVEAFFREGIERGLSLGMKREQIILDPGPGFGKNVAENIAVMAAIPRFLAFGCPLLMAFSHKRFIAALSGEEKGNTPLGNLAAAAYCVEQGAHILRLHDLKDADHWLKGVRING